MAPISHVSVFKNYFQFFHINKFLCQFKVFIINQSVIKHFFFFSLPKSKPVTRKKRIKFYSVKFRYHIFCSFLCPDTKTSSPRKFTIMGWFGSSEENNEEKMIDSSGHVNTNIIIQEAKDTHYQAILSEKLVYGTYILIALEVAKLTLCFYNTWKRQMKKKYAKQNPKQGP